MQRRGLNIRKGLLRTILPLLRALPPRMASRFVAGIGHTEYALIPRLRVRFDAAIERGGHHFGRRWNPAEVGRSLAGNHIRWRTRDLLLDGLPNDRVAPVFTVTGRELLDEALKLGQGVILLGNHFGAHLMPAHWLMREGYPLRLFMERPRHVSKFLEKQFETDGPLGQRKLFISRKTDPTEAAGSILRAARILKAGMIVNLAGDVRWSGAHTAAAKFLGETYTFSATWVTLAAMTGAPIAPVFCRMNEDGSYQLEFLPHYHVPPDAVRSGQVSQWVQACLCSIEERIERDPANSNEYFFWAEPEELCGGAATDERGSAARSA
ncbi:MAG TPA: lysophospholipid acyltransferase family protein [Isosphaeraceae bacterium]|jgi:KDO2-lipid IV(A) lauroyltransferase|nr:lysophospholipid acyltransferase family protein [Isosphaeraceae bacterium]